MERIYFHEEKPRTRLARAQVVSKYTLRLVCNLSPLGPHILLLKPNRYSRFHLEPSWGGYMVQNTRHLTLSVDILAGSGKKALD